MRRDLYENELHNLIITLTCSLIFSLSSIKQKDGLRAMLPAPQFLLEHCISWMSRTEAHYTVHADVPEDVIAVVVYFLTTSSVYVHKQWARIIGN